MARSPGYLLPVFLMLASTNAASQTMAPPLPPLPQDVLEAPATVTPPIQSAPSNDAILATLDDELASDIRALMEEAPSNVNKVMEPVESTMSPTLSRGQSGIDANGNPKQIILSNTKVEEWKQQLIKVSGEWETSLFFSKKDVGRLQNALEWRQRIEDRSPNILQTIESYLNPEKAPEVLPLAPLSYETFRLKSIVIDPRGGWTIFLNDQKLNSKSLDPEAEIVPVAVNSRSVTFRWTPSDTRIIEEMLKTAQAMTAETKKALEASNRIAATIPESNIDPEGSITFTLRPNQSFVTQHAAIYEGIPPTLAAQNATVAQQSKNILGTEISPEEIMRKFPGTEETGGAMPMMQGILPGTNPAASPATLPTEVGNEFDQRNSMANSLSSIINQTRGNVQRLQNP
jgi:hypothetical protein